MAKTQRARNYIKTSFISIINSQTRTERERRVQPETSSFAPVVLVIKESIEKKRDRERNREERKEKYLSLSSADSIFVTESCFASSDSSHSPRSTP